MAQALAAAATNLARQVVRSELQTRPELVARVAAEALDTLLLSARHITLRVHPDDQPTWSAEGAAEVLAARGGRIVGRCERRPRRLPDRIRHRQRRRDDGRSAGSRPSPTLGATGRLERCRRCSRRRRRAARLRPHGTPLMISSPLREPGARRHPHGRPLGRSICRAWSGCQPSRCRSRPKACWCAWPGWCSRRPASACRSDRSAKCACPGSRRAGRGGRLLRRPCLSDADRRYPRPGEWRERDPAADAGGAAPPRQPAASVAPQRGPHPAPAGRRRPARPRRRFARQSDRPQGPARQHAQCAADPPPDQCDGPRSGAPPARYRRARDQRDADGRPRPAHRPVCRHRRRQVGAARHDGALHRGRRDRGRA